MFGHTSSHRSVVQANNKCTQQSSQLCYRLTVGKRD